MNRTCLSRLALAVVSLAGLSLACGLPRQAQVPDAAFAVTQTMMALDAISAATLGALRGTPPPAEPPADTPPPPPAEATPVPSPTPTVVHLTRPSEPGYVDRFMTDISSETFAPEHRSVADNFPWNNYERPLTAPDMVYQPYLDLVRSELAADSPWIYVTLFLVEAPPTEARATYGVEIDLNTDGRGDWLITAALPLPGEWATDGVRVYHDDNDDVGGAHTLAADLPPQLGDGYEEMVFDQAQGDDPDAAWARVAPGHPERIQIAFKHSIIANDAYLLWGTWADGATDQPGWFDYNDHFTLAEAGSPILANANYPLDQLPSLDNTCRWAFDFDPTENLPGMCAIPPTPTPTTPPGSISGRVYGDYAGNPGVEEITVQLRSGGCAGSVIASAVTPASGAYSFSGLGPGNYCVSVVNKPCEWRASNPASGQISITLSPGENRTGVNFGMRQVPC